MTRSLAAIQVNPFDDDVVREPREVSFSVPGLNDAPLNKLLAEFFALDAGAVPRERPATARKVQLVVSPDRGYGKSHLLGRVFAALGRQATKVYLRPFQDPYKAWHSILLLTIQELDRSDDDQPGAPSQLEALAVGTLAHVVADFAEDGIPDRAEAPQAVAFLRKLGNNSSLPEAETRKWVKWLGELIADSGEIGRLCARLKARRHVDLLGREKAWLRVFAACALDGPYGERRTAALKWLRAEPLEADEVALLRIDAADNEGKGDSSAQEINDLSFRRLCGLCQLASYYRPFVFCFDQTEFYASDVGLIRTLGNCIDQLYVDLPNHLTVITANQENWVTEIQEHIAQPQRERMSSAITLEGIRIDGARELITERLREYGLDNGILEKFFADGWLDDVFTPIPELGVRALLMRAAERFRSLQSNKPPAPKPSLDDLFRLEVNGVRAKRALLAYNQDCLMWFAKDIGRSFSDIKIGRPPDRRYFSLEWRWPDRQVCFAFEGGDHWRRWQAIADEAIRMARAQGEGTFLAYVFRTPDLAKVPRPTWNAAAATLDEAKRHGFHIVELTADQVCEIHAARELYSNARQGNIAYSGAETLAWLQARFVPFLKEIAFRPIAAEAKKTNSGKADGKKPVTAISENAAPAPIPAPTAGLDDAALRIVLDMMREQRIADISAVLDRLGSRELRDRLLRSVEAHPNLKAHPGPQTIYLQWRITA
jgi:hypothetical protein